jgi:hypothetical protein
VRGPAAAFAYYIFKYFNKAMRGHYCLLPLELEASASGKRLRTANMTMAMRHVRARAQVSTEVHPKQKKERAA